MRKNLDNLAKTVIEMREKTCHSTQCQEARRAAQKDLRKLDDHWNDAKSLLEKEIREWIKEKEADDSVRRKLIEEKRELEESNKKLKESWKKERDNLNTRIRGLEQQNEAFLEQNGELSNAKSEAERKFNELAQDHKELKENQKYLVSDHAKCKKFDGEMEELKKSLKTKEEELRQTQNEFNSYKEKKCQICQVLIEKNESLQKALDEKRSKGNNNDAQCKDCEKMIEFYNQKLVALEQGLKAEETKRSEMEIVKRTAIKESADLKRENARLTEKMNRYENRDQFAEQVRNQLRTEKAKVDNVNKELKEERDKRQDAEIKLEEKEAELDKLRENEKSLLRTNQLLENELQKHKAEKHDFVDNRVFAKEATRRLNVLAEKKCILDQHISRVNNLYLELEAKKKGQGEPSSINRMDNEKECSECQKKQNTILELENEREYITTALRIVMNNQRNQENAETCSTETETREQRVVEFLEQHQQQLAGSSNSAQGHGGDGQQGTSSQKRTIKQELGDDDMGQNQYGQNGAKRQKLFASQGPAAN